jgi:hypothetical protein
MQHRRSLLMVGLLSAAVLLLAGWLGRSMMPTAGSRTGQAGDSDVGAASDDVATEGTASESGRPIPIAQVDFSGQWQLDLKASDSLDAILAACGISAIERMILDNAPITQDVRQTREEITIDVTSGPYHRTDVMWLDGRRTKSEDPAGRPVVSESFWNDEGTAVITKIWQENLLDLPPWTMTRTLSEDGNTAYVLNEYAPVDGAPLASRRIYHRLGPAPDKSR